MSELIVEVVLIGEINVHPNADRLELASVKGWKTVVPKGMYKKGDKVVYIPIDSILPHEVENVIFPPESKVKLSKSRVRTIKLRGAISQGMVVKLEDLGLSYAMKVGTDVADRLKITKHEPVNKPNMMRGAQRSKKQTNPNFRKFTDINNHKNYPDLFSPGDIVVVTEKIHGTNFRAGWVNTEADTLWKKIKNLFGMLEEYEFVYGSHNVQLQNKLMDGSLYGRCCKKYNLEKLLKPGQVIYGEIYGHGIQKGYNYGCKPGEFGLVVFDLKIDDVWQRYDQLQALILDFLHNNVDTPIIANVLYTGWYDFDTIKALTVGNSVLVPEQKVIEGVVIRSGIEEDTYAGRKMLKLISDEYLLNKNNTDFH